MFRIPIITALFVGALIAASDAQADTLTVSTSCVGCTTQNFTGTTAVNQFGVAFGNGVVGNILSANQNFGFSGITSPLLAGNALLTNPTTSSETVTLTITLLETTLPRTAPLVATNSLVAFLNSSSTTASTSLMGTFNGSVSSTMLPLISFSATAAGTATQPNPTEIGPFSTSSLIAASLLPPFSVTETFALTLGPNSVVNLLGFSTQLTPAPAVPLPAALPLFATGLVGLGLLGWRRKKKAAA